MIRTRLGASARGTPRVPPSALPTSGPEGTILQIRNNVPEWRQPVKQQQLRVLASAVINAGNVTLSFDDAARIFLTLDVDITGTLTLNPPTLDPTEVQHVSLLIEQGAGGQTIAAYSANVLFPAGGAPPVLSVGAGEVDILAGIADANDNVIRMVASLGFPT